MNQPLFGRLVEHEVVPCDMSELTKGYASDANRVVGSDFVGRVYVSTVFLGINHQFADHGPPLWFETMVFYRGSSVLQRRHATWCAARLEHTTQLNYFSSSWIRTQLLLSYLFVGAEAFVNRLRGDRDD